MEMLRKVDILIGTLKEPTLIFYYGRFFV